MICLGHANSKLPTAIKKWIRYPMKNSLYDFQSASKCSDGVGSFGHHFYEFDLRHLREKRYTAKTTPHGWSQAPPAFSQGLFFVFFLQFNVDFPPALRVTIEKETSLKLDLCPKF